MSNPDAPEAVDPELAAKLAALPYTFTQTLQEATVSIPLSASTKKSDVVVVFKPLSIKAGLKGQPAILDGPLDKKIKPEECNWYLDGNQKLVLELTKHNQMEWWKCVMQGDPGIDTTKIQPENSKLSDLDSETRTMVEKMMFDQRAKQAGQPTSEQLQKQDLLKNFMNQHPEMDFSNAKIG